MKALHIFPQFTPDLASGSERYEFMLSRALAARGVEIEVLTTTTRVLVPASAFSTSWPDDNPERESAACGLTIRRFPVSFSVPTLLGHAGSRVILKRWAREERREGWLERGSRNSVEAYRRRALARPRIYDLFVTAMRGPYSYALLRHLKRCVSEADVLLVGFTPFSLTWQVLALARRYRKPVVVLALFHPQDVYHHFRAIYRSLARADAVLAQTPYSAALMRQLAPGARPLEIGAGVNLAEVSGGSGTRFRLQHGLDRKRLILLVGRKEYHKRYDLAVAALELLGDERIHLVMVGRDIDRRPIQSPYVTYLGELSDAELDDAYDACDLLVLPSENESFGIVLLEAWARRKPVIGNRFCGPVASVIAEDGDGLLCATAAELAAGIARLVADPELAARLGEAGYRKVTARYNWESIAGRVHDLYERLIVERTAVAPPALAEQAGPQSFRTGVASRS